MSDVVKFVLHLGHVSFPETIKIGTFVGLLCFISARGILYNYWYLSETYSHNKNTVVLRTSLKHEITFDCKSRHI